MGSCFFNYIESNLIILDPNYYELMRDFGNGFVVGTLEIFKKNHFFLSIITDQYRILVLLNRQGESEKEKFERFVLNIMKKDIDSCFNELAQLVSDEKSGFSMYKAEYLING